MKYQLSLILLVSMLIARPAVAQLDLQNLDNVIQCRSLLTVLKDMSISSDKTLQSTYQTVIGARSLEIDDAFEKGIEILVLLSLIAFEAEPTPKDTLPSLLIAGEQKAIFALTTVPSISKKVVENCFNALTLYYRDATEKAKDRFIQDNKTVDGDAFASCILSEVPRAQNEYAARLIENACEDKYAAWRQTQCSILILRLRKANPDHKAIINASDKEIYEALPYIYDSRDAISDCGY